MSLRALEWAFEQDGPRMADRLVLLVLADYADQTGAAWPSMKRIAKRAGLTLDAARAATRRLEHDGFVLVEERRIERDRNRSNVYRLAMASDAGRYEEEVPPDEGGAPVPEGGTPPSAQGAPAPPPTGGTSLPPHGGGEPPVKNPQTEPPENPGPMALFVVESVPPSIVFEDFWRTYPRRVGRAEAAKAWGRAVKVATPGVILAAAAAWRDAGLDPQFTPHPTTWLNQRRWEDDLAEVAPASSAPVADAQRLADIGRALDARQQQKGIGA